MISDTTRKLAIRAIEKDLSATISKLETGFFFECPNLIDKRDALISALIELGHTPAFCLARCSRLHAAFPFIPDANVLAS